MVIYGYSFIAGVEHLDIDDPITAKVTYRVGLRSN